MVVQQPSKPMASKAKRIGDAAVMALVHGRRAAEQISLESGDLRASRFRENSDDEDLDGDFTESQLWT